MTDEVLFNTLAQRDREVAEALEGKLAEAYARELKRFARQAAKRLKRHRYSAITAAASDWHLPDPDELLNLQATVNEMRRRTEKLREQVAEAAVSGTLAHYGIAFDLSNPVLAGVIETMGRHITRVVEGQRAAIMQALQEAYDKGLSLRDASRLVVSTGALGGIDRARLIARTELTAATSGGSLAAATLVSAASPTESALTKIWIATDDDRVRDSHAEAADEYGEGNGIPLDQPFLVGGEELQHPGDPSGAPEETVNCRCTCGYEQTGALTASAATETDVDRQRTGVAPTSGWHARMGANPRVGAPVAGNDASGAGVGRNSRSSRLISVFARKAG